MASSTAGKLADSYLSDVQQMLRAMERQPNPLMRETAFERDVLPKLALAREKAEAAQQEGDNEARSLVGRAYFMEADGMGRILEADEENLFPKLRRKYIPKIIECLTESHSIDSRTTALYYRGVWHARGGDIADALADLRAFASIAGDSELGLDALKMIDQLEHHQSGSVSASGGLLAALWCALQRRIG